MAELLSIRKIQLLIQAQKDIEAALLTYTTTEVEGGHAKVFLDDATREAIQTQHLSADTILTFPGNKEENQVMIPAEDADIYASLVELGLDAIGISNENKPALIQKYVSEEIAHLNASLSIPTIEQRYLGISLFWIPTNDGTGRHRPGLTGFLKLKGTTTIEEWRQIISASPNIDGSDAVKLGLNKSS